MAAGIATLVLGGSSSGKSMYAQRLARELGSSGGKLCYLATMRPMDGEDDARVAKHRRDREGWGFETLEIPVRVGQASCAGGTVLLDSVTTLLTNAMFSPEGFGADAEEGVWAELAALIGAASHTVLVSDDLFYDGQRYDEGTESFRRQLGHLHQRLARVCGRVVKLTCGTASVWKSSADNGGNG